MVALELSFLWPFSSVLALFFTCVSSFRILRCIAAIKMPKTTLDISNSKRSLLPQELNFIIFRKSHRLHATKSQYLIIVASISRVFVMPRNAS